MKYQVVARNPHSTSMGFSAELGSGLKFSMKKPPSRVGVVANIWTGHLPTTICKRYHLINPARPELLTSHSFQHTHGIDTRICEEAEELTSLL